VKLVHYDQFTVVRFYFGLISNLFSCRYASRTLRIKLLTLISSNRLFNLKNWLWKGWAKLHHIKKSQDNSHQAIRYAEITF